MIESKYSNDPDLQRALEVWSHACSSAHQSVAEARRLHTEFVRRGSTRAAAWMALTRGRMAARAGDLDAAEECLTEAFGRFHLINDPYGKGLVDSHIAMLLAIRGEFDRAL